MEKKKLTTNEIFCGMPFLLRYFQDLDRKIRVYTPEGGVCEEVEKLKEKKKELLATVKRMDSGDLTVLYYIHKIDCLFPLRLSNALKRLVEAQEELKTLLKTGETNEEPR